MEVTEVDERFLIRFEYRPEYLALVARFHGLLTFQDLLQIAPQVHGHPNFPDVRGVLFDMRAARTGHDPKELRRFVDLLAERREPRGYRAAYLVEDDFAFGMTRMFDALAEGLHDRARMIFREERAAFAWLSAT